MATFRNQSYKNVSNVETVVLTSTSDSTIILSILVANTDGASASDVSCRRKNGATDLGYLAFTVVVPADSNVDILGNKYILPSGHSLHFLSSSSGTLDTQISYVEV